MPITQIYDPLIHATEQEKELDALHHLGIFTARFSFLGAEHKPLTQNSLRLLLRPFLPYALEYYRGIPRHKWTLYAYKRMAGPLLIGHLFYWG